MKLKQNSPIFAHQLSIKWGKYLADTCCFFLFAHCWPLEMIYKQNTYLFLLFGIFPVKSWWPIWMTFWKHRTQHSRWKNSKINSKRIWMKNGMTSLVPFGIHMNCTNGSPNWMKRSENRNNNSSSSRLKRMIQSKIHGKWPNCLIMKWPTLGHWNPFIGRLILIDLKHNIVLGALMAIHLNNKHSSVDIVRWLYIWCTCENCLEINQRNWR